LALALGQFASAAPGAPQTVELAAFFCQSPMPILRLPSQRSEFCQRCGPVAGSRWRKGCGRVSHIARFDPETGEWRTDPIQAKEFTQHDQGLVDMAG
jgi:hypothetical protein